MSIEEIPGARPYFGGKDKIATISNDIKKALETGQISLGDSQKSLKQRPQICVLQNLRCPFLLVEPHWR